MIFPTPKQMKTIEENSEKNGVSCRELMENAGGALTMLIYKIGQETDISSGVVFVCGSGNNGGDGFVAARLLAESGSNVTVVLACGDPSTELAAMEYCELSGVHGVEVLNLNDNIDKVFSKFASAAVIVDCVFGTGFHGFLPPQIKACFSFAQRSPAIKIAADVPSGADCLKGTVEEGTLKCDYTVTFGYKKIGMLFEPLAEYCGEIVVGEIGLPAKAAAGIELLPALFEEKDVTPLFPKRAKNSHKGDFGKLLNVAGCANMSGAAALSTKAALRSGAGLVTLASSETVISRIAAAMPEAMYVVTDKLDADAVAKECDGKDAVAVGCGLSVTAETKKLVEKIIKNAACTVILDADGINCLADNIDIIRDKKAELIITPPAGELARLCGTTVEEAVADRLTLAVNLSREYGVTVVAKGSPTIVVGKGKAYIIPAGNPGLSRGGSGDVLTGIIAAFAAQGLEPVDAAAAGVFVHGAAADLTAEKLSEMGMLPSDVIENLPFVFKTWNR
ncbi:MAG: NAD(P)H-hydrate dehydratase [Oscillospiraceae bacterium]|nr:NAD(P)H-hydrate dehydratase [Oscillospiraceae bacterium]